MPADDTLTRTAAMTNAPQTDFRITKLLSRSAIRNPQSAVRSPQSAMRFIATTPGRECWMRRLVREADKVLVAGWSGDAAGRLERHGEHVRIRKIGRRIQHSAQLTAAVRRQQPRADGRLPS